MCVEDVGALLLGPSTLMADPFGPLLDEDEERALSEGSSSPLSFSSYSESYTSSPFSPFSAPAPLGCKVGSDLLPLPWLSAGEQIDAHVRADQKEGDAFSGMDWMTEKIDLSDFDLDSLIGSCDLDEPPSSPEELLASLESQMDLDLAPLPFPSSSPSDPEELGLPPLSLDLPLPEPPADPEVHPEPIPIEIKSEPLSPAFTLELGSEVDISELEKVVSKASSDQQTPSIVLSLSPAHIVVVLAPKEEVSVMPSSCAADQSDSGIESVSGSPPHNPSPAPSPKPVGTSRTKPYSKPDPDSGLTVVGKVKTVSGKSVDKKLKKMEQNKTAATRYRQKKRVEQESLNVECTELEKRNHELSEKADSISREIQYLKDLIEEVRSAKNRKNKTKVDSP